MIEADRLAILLTSGRENVSHSTGQRLVLHACGVCLRARALAAGEPLHGQSRIDTSFAARVEQLSEPGGYFDTDNLISNERSYLHPLDALRERGVTGGVYIGVGPDQNFRTSLRCARRSRSLSM